MAAPPPDGFSRRPQDPAAPAAAGERVPLPLPGEDRDSRGPLRHHSTSITAAGSLWLWLPVALSSLLLVLFVVVVNRQQAQAQRLGELLSRMRTLEQSRAQERTAVLEQQLRAMLTRLQTVEKGEQQATALSHRLQMLQAELQDLRETASRPPLPATVSPPQPATPAASSPSAALQPRTTLRPPATP